MDEKEVVNLIEQTPENGSGIFELSYRDLVSLPSEIGSLKHLIKIILIGNRLMYLPEQIGNLTALKILNLNYNDLTSLPAEIGKLMNLEELHLYNNKLCSLPVELGKLTNLKELRLSGNQLRSLPAELGKLTKLKALSLEGNPLESPPQEVVKQGTQAVLAYLRELGKEERREWVSKLLVVGEGGVGKTSLLKRLLGEGFNPDQKTTHGLQIRTLTQPHPREANVEMCLNAWDFGGQYILHATHQFFLTKRSLFILVWNARHGWQHGKIYYWLDVIHARAPESTILIVATHTEDWPADLPYEEILSKYPQVCGRFSVSNERGTGIDVVKEAIQREAAELPLMGERCPAVWLNLAEEVRELRKTKAYIYPNELSEVIRENDVREEDKGILSTWLHDLGDILYFKDNPELSDIIILNPEWVASNISHMLEDAEIEKGLGIFRKEHMEAVWPNIEPPVRDVFLRLMEQFDLSFRTLEDKDISIVVERLSLNASESAKGYEEIWDARKGDNEIKMKFYLNTSLPPGIPTWFIARSHRFTTYKHWRYGALFADGKERKHLALVRAYDHERYLMLMVRGPAPHNFFVLLRDGLEVTLKRYPGLNVERKIPCPGHRGKDCDHEFAFDQLEKALEKKKMLIECPEALDDVSVAKMLFGLHWRTESNVITRIDELEEKVITGQENILTEFGELKELTQREFLRLFNAQQRLVESHCPNVFAVLPKEERGWLKNIFGQKMVMQLYCQAPGEWHPTVEGGRYEIKQPAEFFKDTEPYILKLAKVIKYAAPVAGAAAGLYAGPIGAVMGAEFGKKLAGQVKLMEELAKKLGDEREITAGGLLGDIGKVGRVEEAEGSALRALRKLLDEVDPKQNWGGLKKILTPEGHYLWLCSEHAEEYRR